MTRTRSKLSQLHAKRTTAILQAFIIFQVAFAPPATAQPVAAQSAPPSSTASCDPSAVCSILVAFYRATTAHGCAWSRDAGWSAAAAASGGALCAALPRTSAETGLEPPFCGWYGVRCCGKNATLEEDALYDAGIAERARLPLCSRRHAITALHLPYNGLCGALGDAAGALAQLHACGLTDLSLASNNLTGTLPPTLGQLTNIRRAATRAPLC